MISILIRIILYHICLRPLLTCKQPWHLDVYSSQKIRPDKVPTINIKAQLELLLIRYYHPSFLFVEFISKHLQSYGRFSFYWIYNLDIWFYSNNFWKNLDVHLPSSFAQCKLANKQIRFEYVWNHIFQCPLNVVEIFYGEVDYINVIKVELHRKSYVCKFRIVYLLLHCV